MYAVWKDARNVAMQQQLVWAILGAKTGFVWLTLAVSCVCVCAVSVDRRRMTKAW